MSSAPDSQHGTKAFGIGFTLVAWVLALALATWLFADWEAGRANPNRELSVRDGGLELKRNRQGHYLADGSINGHKVPFLLDIGATFVAIPEVVANRLGLEKMARSRSNTAAGEIDTWLTRLDEVRLGPIVVRNVPASINPYMAADDEILLGMAFLKHLELVQRGDTLTLRQ